MCIYPRLQLPLCELIYNEFLCLSKITPPTNHEKIKILPPIGVTAPIILNPAPITSFKATKHKVPVNTTLPVQIHVKTPHFR